MRALLSSGIGWARSHGDVALFTASSITKMAAQFIAGLVTVRLVAPEDLGLWNSVSLATTYALFLQAGVINGLGRELPFQLGADNPESARKLAGTAQSFMVGGNILVVLGGVVALFLYRGRGVAVELSIAAVTLVTLATFYQNYLTVTFRSKSSFMDLARAQFWTASLLILTLPALLWWKYNGVLLRAVTVTSAAVWLMHCVRPIRVKCIWDGPSFKNLMATGLPIFALAYLENASATTDRIVLLKFGGVEQVGYYSLALYAWQALTVIPMSLAQYMYPRMSFAYGKDGNPRALWTMSVKFAGGIFLVMAPLAALCALVVPMVIPALFPQYAPGVPATQILGFAAVFYGAAYGVNALISMKAWGQLVTYQLAVAGFRVICPIVGATLSPSPLIGVAWGMLAAQVFNFMLGMVLTYYATHAKQQYSIG